MAALLSCGPDAVLSHRSAAALWGIYSPEGSAITVTVAADARRRRPGVTLYRTTLHLTDVTQWEGVPVTAPARTLREVLDRRVFVLTDSELERRFLPIARRAGLPLPETGVLLNGFKVDFYWPHLGLVVKTDGLRYHRTPSQQARDRLRDQAHTAAGLTPLRFTYAQVRYEPRYVRATLARVARRLS